MNRARTPHRYAILVSAAAVLVIIAIFGWKGFQAHAIAMQSIPARPNLASWPAAFPEAVVAAEARANHFLHAADGLTQLGRLYQANGFYNEASACYRGLAELDPRNPRWPYQLAGILSGFGRLEEALPWQQRAVRLAPDNAVCHVRLGDMQLKSNQTAAARLSYASALKADSANVYALLGLARCEIADQKWPAARALLQSAVERQSTFTGGWDLLAAVHEQLGDVAAAQDDRRNAKIGQRFREAPEPWPVDLLQDCYDAYQLSVSAAASPDKADAQRKLERSVELAPKASGYHRQLARLLIAQGNLPAARQHLETAVAFVPTDAEAWSELINILTTLQDATAARMALSTALANCPLSSYLHFLNGNRLAELNRLTEAEQEYQVAKKLQPNEARSHVQLSAVYARQDRFDDAIAEIKAARAVEPANAEVGVLLVRLGILTADEANARQWLRDFKAMPRALPAQVEELTQMYREQFGHDAP